MTSNAVSAQYTVTCPTCGSAGGLPCRSSVTKRVTDTHKARIDRQVIETNPGLDRIHVYQRLFDRLLWEMDYRPGRTDWVAKERAAMHAEVNKLRTERGKDLVSVDVIIRAENLAVGHSDYATKFALNCADLVVEL